MIVEAIADFDSEVLKSLGVNLKRERSRSRDHERNNRTESNHDESILKNQNFTFFKTRDMIKVLADGGNGWWFGHLIKVSDSKEIPKGGYFPSNYVVALNKGIDLAEGLTSKTEQAANSEDNQADLEFRSDDDEGGDYAEFAKKLISKEQVVEAVTIDSDPTQSRGDAETSKSSTSRNA
jgi:hypothetical protein